MFNKNIQIYRLFKLLKKKRKRQLYLFIFLIIINGLFESFSIATIIPFITLIASPNKIENIPFIYDISSFFGLRDNSQVFLLLTILFSIFIILSTSLRIFNMRYIYRFSAKLEHDLSNLIFRNNIYQPYRKYTKKNSSDIISVTLDKVAATSGAIIALLTVSSGLVLGMFMIISLLLIDWRFVIIGLILLFINYSIILKKVRASLYSNGLILSEQDPYRIRILQEVFFGFRDVIINQNEKIYINLFSKYTSAINLSKANSSFLQIFPRFLLEGFVIIFLVIIGYFLTFLKIDLITLIPLLGAYIYVFQRLIPLVQQVYAAITGYITKSPSIRDVIDEIEQNNYHETKVSKSKLKFKNEISLDNISFSYEDTNLILENINLNIYKGEHIGICGETGGGKSTLLDIIMGLIPPTKGKIFVDNIDLYEKNKSQNWISLIAHVSQNVFLKEGSIAENIIFGDKLEKINYDLLNKVSKTACIYDFIINTRDGFQTQVGERGIRLSGGQKQRIAIARALYKSREILVLDEATSALDEQTEQMIIDGIKKLNKVTIIMVSHRSRSLKICDRLFKVKEKKLTQV